MTEHGENDRPQAPHILVVIFARGLLHHLVTRAYFKGHPLNDADPVLSSIRDPRARNTLLAMNMSTTGPRVFDFDVALQGPLETVFFDV